MGQLSLTKALASASAAPGYVALLPAAAAAQLAADSIELHPPTSHQTPNCNASQYQVPDLLDTRTSRACFSAARVTDCLPIRLAPFNSPKVDCPLSPPNMSTLEELDALDRQERDDKKDKKDGDKNKQADGDAEMKDAEEDDILDAEILSLSTEDIKTRRRLLENDARIMRSEYQRLSHEKATMKEKIKENLEKIANNR